VISAIGLGTLGAFLLITEGRLRSNALNADLRLQATQGVRSVWFDKQTFHSEAVSGDETLHSGYPQLYVMLRGEGADDGSPTVEAAVKPRSPYYRGAPIDQAALDAITSNGEVITRHRFDGGARVRLLATPFSNADGDPGGAMVAIADEQQLGATQRRLRLYVAGGGTRLLLSSIAGFLLAGRSIRPAARALAQQERFLADAAHEIRTPVAAIRALAEGGAAGDQDAAEALARTGDIATHASQTVDDLLFLARADAGRMTLRRERVRLDLLVDEVVESAAGVTLTASPIVVDADPTLLRRAIANLVDNALRHGRALDPGAGIEISVEHGRVEVRDHGPGVEPGLDGLLFDRFQSGRRSGGTGLGLPLARLVARAHGGDVTLSPGEGGGTVAVLTLEGSPPSAPS
jgi:two-component system, OmpR family, sensor kinase